ncbi:hypothetical protein GOBAR_DD36020 [Gossypium barbadense]|nr:hypothetical protein GOBAR_DD36020 [Gossypium barbadense]
MLTVHGEAVEVPTVHTKAVEAPNVHAEATEEPTIEEEKSFMRSEVINLIGESLDGKLAPGGHGKFKRSRKLKKAYRIWLESSVSREAAESQCKNDEDNIPPAMEDNIPPANPPQDDILAIELKELRVELKSDMTEIK